ncbi:MAG: hypothetical protein ACFFC7_03425 [Candidatus Hermodarchaeota archaeon]
MTNIIEILCGLILLIFIIGNIVYLYGFIVKYLDLTAFYLLIEFLCFDFWIFSISLFLFESLFLFPPVTLILGYYFGNIALLAGLVGFSFMMNSVIFSRIARILSKISIIIYSMIIALNLADLLSIQPLFFLITHNAGVWVLILHPLAFTFSIIAAASTILTITLNVLNPTVLPEYLSLQQKKFRYNLSYGLILFIAIGVISLFITALFLLKLSLLISFLTIIIPLGLLFYFSSTKPFFFLISGTQATLLLEKGYIGYFVASFADYGPTPILISPVLRECMNISTEALENFSVSGLSAMSVYDSLTEKVSLLPVPTIDDLEALLFQFLIPNTEVKDERLVMGAPTFFAIIFPSTMLFRANDVTRIIPLIWRQLREKETLFELSDANFLEKITLLALRQQFL